MEDKRHFYQRWWFWAVIGLLILSSCSGGQRPSTPTAKPVVWSPAATPTPVAAEPTPAPAPTVSAVVSDAPEEGQPPRNRRSRRVSDAAVLEEMRLDYGEDVTGVRVADDGSGSVRIDVYTVYYAKPSNARTAEGMARIAASSDAVRKAYPKVRIAAYVWPGGKEFYMTRASASWTNEHLDAPMDTFTNAVLK